MNIFEAETIAQYQVFRYLQQYFNLDCVMLEAVDPITIKVTDNYDNIGYFSYSKENGVSFSDDYLPF